MAICKYGVSSLSPVADSWYYRGEDYYNVYNTTQEFDSNYSAGIYSILPPVYTLRIKAYRIARFKQYLLSLPSANPLPCTTNKTMRLTKIYFKKFRFFAAFTTGLFTAFIFSFLFYLFILKPSHDTKKHNTSSSINKSKPKFNDDKDKANSEKSLFSLTTSEPLNYENLLKSAKIESIDYLPSVGRLYKFSSGDKKFTSRDLGAKYAISFKSYYEVTIKNIKTGATYSIFR